LVEAVGALRRVFVGGRPEAPDPPLDARTLYLPGYWPALVAAQPQPSLVICLGTGTTAGALAHFGQVTIAELNRAVPGATRQFDDLNRGVLDRARLRLEDVRLVAVEPGPPWGGITIDPIHSHVAGSASLYTTEHLRNCLRLPFP